MIGALERLKQAHAGPLPDKMAAWWSLKCAACTWESQCPRCAARLVLHRQPDLLRCHHWGGSGHDPVP